MRRRHLAAALAALLACAAARADLPELIAAAKPSVVAVGTYSATDSPRFGFRGTGFVVGDGRTIVTNAHVLPSAVESAAHPTLMIQSLQGTQATVAHEVRVVATDLNHDLAVLAFDGDPLPALALGDAPLAPEGTAIAFIGFPIGGVLGFSPVTHHGIVSSLTKIA
ncbi:MAG: trypsin-like peptidase domain-containing protein, partial [Burkholderiales bacterium]|nr:trypsin-like peptidase domain-containing protein [Burkholderiales bacterium]